MFTRLLTIALFMLVATGSLFSQTISSKSTGGDWTDPATWTGGVVPGQSNDVVINGTVVVNTGSAKCQNLTINTGATLRTEAYSRKLTILGSITNNGTIKNHADGYTLTLDVAGNLHNNGTWDHSETRLTGTTDQQISLASGKFFDSYITVTDTLGRINATSALTFRYKVDLNRAKLDMQNYPLTLQGSEANIVDGQVINTADLIGIGLTYIGASSQGGIIFIGSVNIKRCVKVGTSVTFIGTVTVVDTLQNEDWSLTTTVEGNLINNGLIRNHPSGYTFTLDVTGNIHNNGTWDHNETRLTGTADQQISMTTGKFFDSYFSIKDTLGVIKATSALTFRYKVDLNRAKFDMQNYPLTLQGENANIVDGQVINTADLIGIDLNYIGASSQGGITFIGSMNIKRCIKLSTTVTLVGNVTVVDTLQNEDWPLTTTIEGNFTNNGLIRNHPSGYAFTLEVTGNIHNNGIWDHQDTQFIGISDQQISQTTGKTFDSYMTVADTLGVIKATSALTFRYKVDLNRAKLDMQNYPLTLQGENANIVDGQVINTADLIGIDLNYIGASSQGGITFIGSMNIKRCIKLSTVVTLVGNVTVVDTLQNEDWPLTTTIEGNLINNGLIRNHPSGYSFTLNVTGNIAGSGRSTFSYLYLTGTGLRTIQMKKATGAVYSSGSEVILVGSNILPNLTVTSSSKCKLIAGATLVLESGSVTGAFSNWGNVTVIRKPTTTQNYSFFNAVANIVQGSGLDTVTIESYGHQVVQTFGNATKMWWRISRIPKVSSASLSSLRLTYQDDELGSNDETKLEVYHSLDSGKTWRQISTSLNLTRTPASNYVSISDAPSMGDFLLSSSPDPLSVRPSVIVSVIGRSQIRVGPPNRYTIHYFNNSDITTGDMILQIASQGGVFIKAVEPSVPPGKPRFSIPIDSLALNGRKDTVYLWVQSMAPREEQQLDVIFTATPDGQSVSRKSSDINAPTIVPFIIAGLWWAGEALVVAYVTDVGLNFAEEVWRPVAKCETITEALGGAIKDSFRKANERWFSWEKPLTTLAEDGSEKFIEDKLLEKGISLPPGLNMGKKIVEASERTFKGASRYLNNDFKVKDCNGNKRRVDGDVSGNGKSLQKVTSWDPNEKIGPTGVGSQGFITSAGKMVYQILFENKKEATAPAWKVVIVDTLAPEFDPTTVEFGKTSHEGPSYKWKMTVTGNIVKWDIEDIELPPNVTPPQGEGYVTFTIATKPGLLSGTALKNKATITFDLNKPITTNEYVNTLDFTPPTTVMLPLPATLSKRDTVTVKWQSSDGASGSGVRTVTVFGSYNDGPFLPMGTSNVDSLPVAVTNGAYKFYALAVDRVGNVQMTKPATVQTSVSGVVGIEDHIIPFEFALEQNYPNPFNPTTTIRYAIAERLPTTLKIYDMIGRQIATLVDEVKEPGWYTLQWNAGQHSTGIYFYNLTAGTFRETKKLVLIK